MRSLAFFAVGLALILVQSTYWRLLAMVEGWVPAGISTHGWTPSLLLPLVVFLGVHETAMWRGALLAFGLGYSTDLVASAPIGLFTFTSVAVWWLARSAGVRLTAQTMLTRMSLALGFSLVEGGLVWILFAVFGSDNRRPLEMAGVIVPRSISTAMHAPLVFWIAQRLQQGVVGPRGRGDAVPGA